MKLKVFLSLAVIIITLTGYSFGKHRPGEIYKSIKPDYTRYIKINEDGSKIICKKFIDGTISCTRKIDSMVRRMPPSEYNNLASQFEAQQQQKANEPLFTED